MIASGNQKSNSNESAMGSRRRHSRQRKAADKPTTTSADGARLSQPLSPGSKFAYAVAILGAVAVALVAFFYLDSNPAHNTEADRPSAASNGGPFVPADSGYVDPSACAGCHKEIWNMYRETGMAQAFSRLTPEAARADFSVKNTYYHEPSDRHYRMYRRGDAFYMRRHQVGLAGRETNVVERRIDSVIGSGYKARTYLARNAHGELLQLPVAWYTENGGFWAMNPGYDRPDHDGFSRRVKYDCMFCHNSYVETGPDGDGFDADPIYGEDLPQGIDCQRCHGPGKAHLEALAHALTNHASKVDVRASIINPATLKPERRLEVCMQCHLQSTSFRLPFSSQRPSRGVFSYRPGEPLADYVLHFDHPKGSGYDDKFEIAHAAYRLRKSRCFQESDGALTCTTCHDPHRHLSQDTRHYKSACLNCHQGPALGLPADTRHGAAANCLDCHMPQRRTDDVIHVVMTDHYIQRHKPKRDLLAPRKEILEGPGSGYEGEVALYYPPELAATPENELDLAVAQVEAGTNLESGLPRLRRAIEKHQPRSHLYYYELAEASFKLGDLEEAFSQWEETIRRKPDFLPALRNYGKELAKAGRFDKGIAILKQALEVRQGDPRSLHDLALAYFLQGKSADGLSTLRQALAADPDVPEAHNLLATQLYAAGDSSGAREAFTEAIRLNPRYGTAHANLASLLAERGSLDEAEYHYGKAVSFAPDYVKGRLDYGIFLADHRQRFEQAVTHLRAAVRLDPNSAATRLGLGYVLNQNGDPNSAMKELQLAVEREPSNPQAHLYLAGAFEQKGDLPQSRRHYEEVIRYNPSHHAAHYGLGAVLTKQGEPRQASAHFRKASESSNPRLREVALEAARALEGSLPP